MGESGCLTMQQPFSYVSGLQGFEGNGNPIHSLGQSISFGRFVSDSASWEKWSVFSHNRYVEEAERYARPGSVAQKKAFFEAHYREMAARKAAAAAAAAEAEQANTVPNRAYSSPGAEGEVCNSSSALNCNNPKVQNGVGETLQSGKTEQSRKTEMPKPQRKDSRRGEANQEVSVGSGKKKITVIPSKSSGLNKAATQQPLTPAKQSTPAIHSRKEVYATPRSYKKTPIDYADKRRPTPRQVSSSSTTTPRGGINKVTTPNETRKTGGSRVSSISSVSRKCMTPTAAPSNGTSRNAIATPRSSRTPAGPPAAENRSAGLKWQSLATEYSKSSSACKSKLQSPSVSTPFKLKSVERVVRRKEKLEEKFNADEKQKVQQQSTMKEKADLELKIFRQTLCFKAKPLPSFYKESATLNKQMTKAPAAWPQSGGKPGLSSVWRTEDSLPAHIQRPSWNNPSKQIQGKNGPTPTDCRSFRSYMTREENLSPNFQRTYL